MAFILNSLFMTLVFRYSMQGLKRNSKSFQGLGLLIFWSGWEYFHQQWELSWPWLNLGNALASMPAWIQWFQFIGSSGGTLWILLVNLLIFNALINYNNRIYKLTYAGIALGVVIIPIVASYIIGLKSETSAQERVAVVCVQPNSDPYHDKFSSNFNQQFKHIWLPLKNHLTAGTDLVVFPETFVSQAFDLKILKHSYILQTLRDSIFKYAPKARILTGLASYQIFEPGEACCNYLLILEGVAKVYAGKGAKVADLDEAVVEKWRAIARGTAWKDYAEKTALSAELIKLAEGVPTT